MVLSKNKLLFLFLFLSLFVVLSTGCTRQKNDLSRVSITLPAGAGSSKLMSFQNSAPMSMQSVSTQSTDDGPDWNSILNPSTMAEVNCYMIAVTGPEGDMRRNTCTTTTGQSFFVGRWKGAIAAGSTLTLEVPSGNQREVIVFGMKVQDINACRDFKLYDVDTSSISEPHIIGKVIQNLNPGNVTVNIPVTLSGALTLDTCDGPDFDFSHGSMFFGNAPSHADYIKTIGANTDLANEGSFTSPVNLKTGYVKIGNVDPSPTGSTIVTVSSSSTLGNFSPNDEVMVIIMGNGGQLGPSGNNDYGGCGYRGWHGGYEFTKIQTISGTYSFHLDKGTFLDDLYKDADGDGTLFEASDLTLFNSVLNASPVPGSSFCYIQLVKVPHFYNLTIASGTILNAPVFDYASEGGGVLAMRVNGTLSMDTNSTIMMTGRGYQGSSFTNGAGYMGAPFTCSHSAVTGSGGGCATGGTDSAGGGGHGNTSGSPFAPDSGGDGFSFAFAPQGGNGAGEDCGDGSCFGSLGYKIFMGGAGGGSNTVTGGAGGGIVYIQARNLNLTGAGTPYILSKGAGASVSTNGGGGAGGSVFLTYKTTNDYSKPTIDVGGGNSSVWGSLSGGGGAGGRAQATACLSGGTAQTPLLMVASAGAFAAAPSAGANGLPGSIVRYDTQCD